LDLSLCNEKARARTKPTKRAFPHSKAHLGSVGATPQLRRLALSDASIRRKRHENVMSSVMGNGLKLQSYDI
jgi:hypothetical protein